MFVFRGPTEEDRNFITHSWLQSFRDYGYFAEKVANTSFYHFHHKIIESLLETGNVLIIYLESEPTVVLGWACYEVYENALVLHYVYTKSSAPGADGKKQSLRNRGIASSLVNYIKMVEGKENVVYSHLVKAVRMSKDKQVPFIKRRLDDKGWLYNPYSLFANLPSGWQHGTK